MKDNNKTHTSSALPIQESFGKWNPISSAPRDTKSGKFIVTNNINYRDAFGNMSNIWLVSMVHDEGGQVTAFDGDRWHKVQNLTHWMPIPNIGSSRTLTHRH